MSSRRLLVVTNDFPPRLGGIQEFIGNLVARLPADDVLVYTSRWRGWQEWDARQRFRVVREDTGVLLPTPAVRRRAARLVAEHDVSVVWFGAAAPLGLLAPALRAAGAQRIVASTHGHEAGWTTVPGGTALLRRVGSGVDVMTYLTDYTGKRLRSAIGPGAELRRLAPAVDVRRFRPGIGGELRRELGLEGRPVIVCVSRLMPRKGQDMLVRTLPLVHAQVPDAALLLVGGGPWRRRIEALVRSAGLDEHVRLTGSVPPDRLPSYYGAGDVFAMPCRTRLGGLDVEGLGMVFLEAAACGLPVVAGDSGGAPDAVRDGDTGYVVDGRDRVALAARLVELLREPRRAAAMGARGRAWVEREWTWEHSARVLTGLLGVAQPDDDHGDDSEHGEEEHQALDG